MVEFGDYFFFCAGRPGRGRPGPDDGDPKVGTLSAIYKPSLPEDEEDLGTLCASWIESAKELVIRWPVAIKDNGVLCPDEYKPSVVPKDSILRKGKLIVVSRDKDDLRKKALLLTKQKRITLNKPIARKSLDFGNSKNLPDKENTAPSSATSEKGLSPPVAEKRRSEEENRDLVELKIKVQKLEAREKIHLNEIDTFKSLIIEKNDELEQISADNGEKENIIFELKEKLEKNEKNPAAAQIEMAEELNKGLDTLKKLIEAQQNQSSHSFASELPLTPQSSRSKSSVNKEMMVLKGEILIAKSIVLSAVATGKREGDNSRSLRSFIKTMITSLWTDDELATFSLTGEACRSIENAVAKEKFPEDYADAITSFTVKRWADMHTGSKLGDIEVRNAITKNLINAHVRVERRNAATLGGGSSKRKKRAANDANKDDENIMDGSAEVARTQQTTDSNSENEEI